jgi:hypothetical protein
MTDSTAATIRIQSARGTKSPEANVVKEPIEKYNIVQNRSNGPSYPRRGPLKPDGKLAQNVRANPAAIRKIQQNITITMHNGPAKWSRRGVRFAI